MRWIGAIEGWKRDAAFVGADQARSGNLHARTPHDAVVDGVLQIDGPVPTAVRHQIDDGGESGVQVALRVHERDQFAVLQWLQSVSPICNSLIRTGFLSGES